MDSPRIVLLLVFSSSESLLSESSLAPGSLQVHPSDCTNDIVLSLSSLSIPFSSVTLGKPISAVDDADTMTSVDWAFATSICIIISL
jgi:hypothetical protein